MDGVAKKKMKRSPLRKKAPKHSNSWYRKKMVELAKTEAKERDNYTCRKCGRSKRNGYKIDASHIFPEGRYHGMSAMIENIDAMCSSCHMWWHESPAESGAWFKAKFPERYKKLKALSLKIIQNDWKKLYETNKEEIRKLQFIGKQ